MIFLKHSLKILLSISCSKLQFNYTIWKSFFFLFLPLTSSFFITTYQHSILSKHAHPFSYRNAVDQSVIWSVISLLTNMLSLLQSLYTETFVDGHIQEITAFDSQSRKSTKVIDYQSCQRLKVVQNIVPQAGKPSAIFCKAIPFLVAMTKKELQQDPFPGVPFCICA